MVFLRLVGSGGSGSEPEVPVQFIGDGVGGCRAVFSVGPIVLGVPDMDFRDRSDESGLDEFDTAAEVVGSGALVAGLGCDGAFLGQLAQGPGLSDGVGERFFAVDVFSGLDGGGGDSGMPVVRGSDDDGVQLV